MNRVTSSSNSQTKKKLSNSQSQSQPQPPEKKQSNLKSERFPVNPLRGLSTRSSGSSTSSSSNASGSGLTSGEASNGCHRFLLSHSFSSSSSSSSSSLGVVPRRPVRSVAKTPKSAPVVSKPLIRKKPRSTEEVKLKSTLTDKPNLHKSQRCKTNPISGKRPTCKDKASVLKKQSSVSREVKQLRDSQTTIRVDDSIAQSTPVSKLGTGSDLIYRSKGEATEDGGRLSSNSSSYQDRTPPVQASVSPEIQCGNLSASTQSQACYAAGHLLSGVSDKRKCKPKGLLTVGENGFEVGKGKILNDSDEFNEGDFGNDDGSCDNVSMMPLPVDASVHWLLSPCDEEKEHEKELYEDGFSQFPQTVECVGHETPSPLSDRSASPDYLCNISSGKSLSPMDICQETTRRISSSLSPNELFRFRRFIHLSSCDGEASAFDSTPTCELDPSEHLKGDKLSPLSVDTLGSENVIQTPESNSSFDNYFGLSCSQAEIQTKLDVGSDLESLTMTFQSTDLSPRIQASSQDPSCSSFNFESLATSSDSIDLSRFQRALVDRSFHHPHVTLDKVSRTHAGVEKLNSHMPEVKSQQITDTTAFVMQNYKESSAPPGKGRVELLPCSAAESISTDGGGLICSEDSNWMACYKN